MIKGEYIITKQNGEQIVLPNLLVHEGIAALLEKLFQDDGTTVLGTTLYIGLCDETVIKTMVMAGVTTEPTAAGGYARQPVVRNAAAWTLGQIGTEGYRYAISNAVTFTATGANFSRAYTRLFLASALTAGTLISVSSALPTPVQVLNGESFTAQYRFFLD